MASDPAATPLDRRASRRKTRTLSLGRWTLGRDDGGGGVEDGDERGGDRGVPTLNAYAAARVAHVGGVKSEVGFGMCVGEG